MPRLNSPAHQISWALALDRVTAIGHFLRVPTNYSRSQLDRAVAALGYGPDHLVGEEPVFAASYQAFDTDEAWDGLLLTSHVIMGRDRSEPHQPPAPLEGLTEIGLQRRGLTKASELRFAWGEERRAIGMPGARDVMPLLERMITLPSGLCVPPPQPLLPSLPQDPQGLQALEDQLIFRSKRLDLLVELHRVRGSSLSEVAMRDIARRLVLWHHNFFMGRCQQDGWWVSPTPVHQLEAGLRWLWGKEAQRQARGDGVLLDWDTGRTAAGDLARTAATKAAGAAVGAALGVGWSRGHQWSMKRYRAELADRDGLAAFRLSGSRTAEGQPRPLHIDEQGQLGWALSTLTRHEARVLVELLLEGTGRPGKGRKALAAAVESLLPGKGERTADLFYDPDEDERADEPVQERLRPGWEAPQGPDLPAEVLEVPQDVKDRLASRERTPFQVAGVCMILSGIITTCLALVFMVSFLLVCVGVLWLAPAAVGVLEVLYGVALFRGKPRARTKRVAILGLVGALCTANLFGLILEGFVLLALKTDELASALPPPPAKS